MQGARPLLVTQDAGLIDEVLRLAAAAVVEVHLATDAEGARSHWALAPLVLVGADLAPRIAVARLPRRRDVVVLSGAPGQEDWQVAVGIGAEHVASLPDAERWLVDRLTDTAEGTPRNGSLVAVLGTGGGAGASTLAAALAMAAASRGRRVLLVDADPLGGGLDLVLGMEELPGVRWGDLADTRGRLSTMTLQQNLPRLGGLSLLSWGRDGSTVLAADAMAAVLDAGMRGSDLVVVDLPRVLDSVADLVLGRASDALVVTSTHVRSAAAASRLGMGVQSRCASVRLVLRADARGIDADAVTDAVALPLAGHLPYAAGLAAQADEGDPPSLRDGYGRAVAELLPSVGLDLRRSA